MDNSPLRHCSAFSELDRHFARFMERLAGASRPELHLAAALVSCHRGQGHICLDLKTVAGKPWPVAKECDGGPITCPELAAWVRALRDTPVVGAPGEFKPLILDARNRLYLHRYWEYETGLADAIRRRATAAPARGDEQRLRELLERLFPAGASGELDWQRLAAETAVQRQLCIISGGPGTGKTRTLTRILALLIELAGEGPLRFALAAPTGKAAARIQEALRKAREELPCNEAVKARLPPEAKTLHRLLEATPDSAIFRRNAKNPLAADIVVVDEASMVDLALMAKLLDAIPPSAKLILFGDKDQLASVEAGAVLGDICAGVKAPASGSKFEIRNPKSEGSPKSEIRSPLAECVVQLRTNYRFAEASAIQRLSSVINIGDAGATLAVLDEARRTNGEVSWAAVPGAPALKAALKEKLLAGFSAFLEADEPRAALEALGGFRILCAVREGPYGVERLNELAEQILEAEGLIRRGGPWYPHRPVMVTRNDYSLRLFNGDVGAILPDPESGELRAFFLSTENELRGFPPSRLPAHETVFAMTVHKSQGSEFERALLVLPGRDSPLLTRELLYTGLTRARKQVELWADEAVLRAAVARRVERSSGLREALWGSP